MQTLPVLTEKESMPKRFDVFSNVRVTGQMGSSSRWCCVLSISEPGSRPTQHQQAHIDFEDRVSLSDTFVHLPGVSIGVNIMAMPHSLLRIKRLTFMEDKSQSWVLDYPLSNGS